MTFNRLVEGSIPSPPTITAMSRAGTSGFLNILSL